MALERGRGPHLGASAQRPSAEPSWGSARWWRRSSSGRASLTCSAHRRSTASRGDTEIWNNNGPGAVPAAEPAVRADPDVASAAFIQTGIDFQLGGRVLRGFAFTPVKGTFGALDAHRAGACRSRRDGARRAHRGGTSRPGRYDRCSAAPRMTRRRWCRCGVTGIAVLPPGDAGAHLGDGVLVTRHALVRLAGGKVRSPYVIAVTFRPVPIQPEPGPA